MMDVFHFAALLAIGIFLLSAIAPQPEPSPPPAKTIKLEDKAKYSGIHVNVTRRGADYCIAVSGVVKIHERLYFEDLWSPLAVALSGRTFTLPAILNNYGITGGPEKIEMVTLVFEQAVTRILFQDKPDASYSTVEFIRKKVVCEE